MITFRIRNDILCKVSCKDFFIAIFQFMSRRTIIDIIFEAAAVKRIERTGWQILGGNRETLADHTFMTCVISYFLARQMKLDIGSVLPMALFHDFHEARTGDVDKIAAYYITRDQAKANKDIFGGIDPDTLSLVETYEKRETIEAKLVYEANILALLVELKVLMEQGNSNANEWFIGNMKRLKLKETRVLADQLIKTNSQDWWKNVRDDLHKKFENTP